MVFFLTAPSISFSQDDYPRIRNANEDEDRPPLEEKGFKKQNLFVGGNVTASFGSGYTVLGGSPMIGYKLNNYFDAGFAINYVYTGARGYPLQTSQGIVYADKVRQHVFGPGVFLRAYPVPFLFAQAQFEQNFTHDKYVMGTQAQNVNASAPSLLLGAGYASGRIKGGTTFYYLSLLFDVLKDPNSPYIDYDSRGIARIQPIIRAGFNIGLFQRRQRRYQEF